MAITSYTELQVAVENWLARDDLTDRIPEFIVLCEAKLNRELVVRQMEERATSAVDTTTTDPEFISLPTSFQTMRRVRLSGVTGKPELTFLTGTQMDSFRTSSDNASAQPVYFTIMGSEMELAPTPDNDYDLEMIYRKTIPPLAANDPNWLLTLAPDVYLYGTLLEAAAFSPGDERLSLWTQGFTYAVDSLNRLGMAAAYVGPMSVRVAGVTP